MFADIQHEVRLSLVGFYFSRVLFSALPQSVFFFLHCTEQPSCYRPVVPRPLSSPDTVLLEGNRVVSPPS